MHDQPYGPVPTLGISKLYVGDKKMVTMEG